MNKSLLGSLRVQLGFVRRLGEGALTYDIVPVGRATIGDYVQRAGRFRYACPGYDRSVGCKRSEVCMILLCETGLFE